MIFKISKPESGEPSVEWPCIKLLNPTGSKTPNFINWRNNVSALLVIPLLHRYSIIGLYAVDSSPNLPVVFNTAPFSIS
uniref:Uncharacterized protein n=1 Tax=Helianthus annuus TaxID=4232 RepID=A0A251SRN8_HELAN